MRTLTRLLLAAAFAVGASVQAGASVLTIGSPACDPGDPLTFGDCSTLGLSIGALPPIQFPQNAAEIGISVSSGNGDFVESASVFVGLVALPTALFTGVALINGLTIDVANSSKFINAAGAIAGPRTADVKRPGNGNLGGPGPLSGSSFVNVLGLFNLSIPLSAVGNTGASVVAAAGGLTIIVQGTGWTTGNVTITGVTTETPNGAAATSLVFNGFDNRTAGHLGTIQLISPFKVITIGAGAGNLPGLTTQTLRFIPEPGTLMLLLSGLGALAICGFARARKPR